MNVMPSPPVTGVTLRYDILRKKSSDIFLFSDTDTVSLLYLSNTILTYQTVSRGG
jgi:hypothetical protein